MNIRPLGRTRASVGEARNEEMPAAGTIKEENARGLNAPGAKRHRAARTGAMAPELPARMLLSWIACLLVAALAIGPAAVNGGGALVHAATPSSVSSVSPNACAQGESVNNVVIEGAGFELGASVWLNRPGENNILGANVITTRANCITCSFAIPLNAATGNWSLCVANPGSQAAGLSDCFTVTGGAVKNWYFAEGTARSNFETYFTVQNSSNQAAEVRLDFQMGDGANSFEEITVPPVSRATVRPSDLLGKGDTDAYDYSTLITCTNGVQVVAERSIYFNYTGTDGKLRWRGGSGALGTNMTADKWYFAEGTCRPNFDTWFTIQNPGDEPAQVVLTYQKGDGKTATQIINVQAKSRRTIYPRALLGTADDDAHDFCTVVSSDRGIVVERPVYFNYNGVWDGGHVVPGATSPSSTFYFAEGTSRPGFDEYICLQNPQAQSVKVSLKYTRGDGGIKYDEITIPAKTRRTVTPKKLLGSAHELRCDFSTTVTADQEIVAERPIYFSLREQKWNGGTNVMGASAASPTWYLSEGCARPGFIPYICVQNPGNNTANVVLTFMKGDGSTEQSHLEIPGNTRKTVHAADIVGAADAVASDFSTLISSDMPIIVERPMYFSYNGWDDGSCVTGYSPYEVPVMEGDTLDGVPMPAYSGRTAVEQHLALTPPMDKEGEEASLHYELSGLPEGLCLRDGTPLRNGMAWETSNGPGYGAWGKAPPVEDERYYICMRWNYTALHGQEIYASKDWYYRKRVLITNPANGRKVVCSIIEYGPHPSVNRVSGLSPEAMYAIGAITNDTLLYNWAPSQVTPLGPYVE